MQETCNRSAEDFVFVRVTLSPSLATSHLDGPALAAGVAAQKVVGWQDVGDAQVGAVVGDLFSGVQHNDAEEHDLGEARGVIARTGSFQFGG
jgi:hypothetical protein